MKYVPLLSCRQASRLITASFDRPLGPLERLGLRRHLQICSACRVVVRHFDHIRDGMRAWGREVADASTSGAPRG